MKVIKNINNNISLCLDSRNNEVVAFGKGIGFTKPPYDVPLSKIDRTFYDVDEEQLAVLNRIPENVLEAAAEIVDLANEKMDNQFRENVVFTLADHIDFSVQRYRKNINIKLPLFYEVRQLYPKESEIGKQALNILKKRLDIALPREEAAAIALHHQAFGGTVDNLTLEHKGLYNFRKDGEKHAWNPETISALQLATRLGSYKKFKEYTHLVDEKDAPVFLRDFLTFRTGNPIPVEEVEPASEIMKRFVTGAMSFGSISKEAHETMAMAMNKIHGRSNTGEGGEDSTRSVSYTHLTLPTIA